MSKTLELWSFLKGDKEADAFDYGKYYDGEQNIIKPALERRGYSHVSFYMIEKDSFGPLIRGVIARSPTGETTKFFYG